MEIVIEIKSENEDCQTEADLVRHLRALAKRIEQNGLDRTYKIMDGNGNAIGTIEGGVNDE